MGPFPHDAPPAKITDANPMGTDGFEFVEFTHPDPKALDHLFRIMGFTPVARHRAKDVTLYRQGGINFIVNAAPSRGSLQSGTVPARQPWLFASPMPRRPTSGRSPSAPSRRLPRSARWN
jgi:Hydroxyphenylpyruvate dioxygenase, HPPD, N-terminal